MAQFSAGSEETHSEDGTDAGLWERRIEALKRQLASSDEVTRAKAINEIRSAAIALCKLAVVSLNSQDLGVRQEAAITLEGLRHCSKRAIPRLAELVKTDVNCDEWALNALSTMGSAGVPGIVAALGDEHRANAAILTLRGMGSDAEHAAKPLADLMVNPDTDRNMRYYIAEALGEIGGPSVDALLARADDGVAEIRSAAAYGLGFGHSPDKRVLDALRKLLEDWDDEVRGNAIESCAQLAVQGEPLVQPVIKALGDKHEANRTLAVKSLGKIGKPAVPLLIGELASPDRDRRRLVARSLGLIGKDAVDAVPALSKAMVDSWASGDRLLRTEVESSLSQIVRSGSSPAESPTTKSSDEPDSWGKEPVREERVNATKSR